MLLINPAPILIPSSQTAPGAGPRHLAFAPALPHLAFGTNELDSTMNVYAFDAAKGTLSVKQSLKTTAPNFQGQNFPSEVAVTADGKYVLVANRGENSIAVFSIDAQTGKANYLSTTSCQGNWPRYLGFDLTGDFVAVTNQNSNDVGIFAFNKASGDLKFVQKYSVNSPQDIVFILV